MIPRAVRDYVTEMAAAYPSVFRTVLRASSYFLPNYWIFNQLVQQCGGTVITKARLGNGMPVLALMGDLVSCDISRSGFHEPEVVDLIRSQLTPNTVFFDIGSHIGQYTLLAAHCVVEVHSFEPNPAIFQLLSANVSSNKLSNVRLNNCAVTDFEGEADFHLANVSNTGQSTLLPAAACAKKCRVRCLSLDYYLRTNNVDLKGRKVLAKIDVEGAELGVVRGASLLLAARPTVLFEILPTTPEQDVRELLSMFAVAGYKLHGVGSHHRLLPLTDENRSAYSNVLAIPPVDPSHVV